RAARSRRRGGARARTALRGSGARRGLLSPLRARSRGKVGHRGTRAAPRGTVHRVRGHPGRRLVVPRRRGPSAGLVFGVTFILPFFVVRTRPLPKWGSTPWGWGDENSSCTPCAREHDSLLGVGRARRGPATRPRRRASA